MSSLTFLKYLTNVIKGAEKTFRCTQQLNRCSSLPLFFQPESQIQSEHVKSDKAISKIASNSCSFSLGLFTLFGGETWDVRMLLYIYNQSKHQSVVLVILGSQSTRNFMQMADMIKGLYKESWLKIHGHSYKNGVSQ